MASTLVEYPATVVRSLVERFCDCGTQLHFVPSKPAKHRTYDLVNPEPPFTIPPLRARSVLEQLLLELLVFGPHIRSYFRLSELRASSIKVWGIVSKSTKKRSERFAWSVCPMRHPCIGAPARAPKPHPFIHPEPTTSKKNNLQVCACMSAYVCV